MVCANITKNAEKTTNLQGREKLDEPCDDASVSVFYLLQKVACHDNALANDDDCGAVYLHL